MASGAFIATAIWAYRFAGPVWAMGLPALYFAYLVLQHAKIERQLSRAAQGLAYAEHALSRLNDSWAGRGPTEDYADPGHPYAGDLDLFGVGGLFDLLCTAATQSGQHKLAQWLLHPAAIEVARERQQALQWLTPDAELREQMALLAAERAKGSTMPPGQLAEWGATSNPSLTKRPGAQLCAWGLSLGFLIVIGLWSFTALGPAALLLNAVLAWLAHHRYREPLEATLAGLNLAERELALAAKLLSRVELELGSAPEPTRLQALAANLGVVDTPYPKQQASVAIQGLRSRVSWLEARSNQLVAIPAYLAGWSLHWGCAIDRWRRRNGPQLGLWLDTLAEFEALNALAQFAYDRPHYPYPELRDGTDAEFSGQGLGHPLLPAKDCIANNLSFTQELQVVLISGSNMSGKSTLMRTVGVNTLLALAGSVVCAEKLTLSQLQVGATLRIQDSLQDGQSRFYAEIVRLKQVVDLSQNGPPLLFLLDEVLSGTNSHDRQIGAEQIVRGLIDQGAIGLVTTHDLALAKAADALAPKARNMHFRDQMVEGKLQFDYRLHPGVVQHSNALELMRSIGLKLEQT